MKAIMMVIAGGCAMVLAQPAFADGLSLSKGVKACKAELAQHTPPLKRYIVDREESLVSDKQLWIAFNVLDEEGRMAKFTCTVDRVTRIAAVERKKPKLSDYRLATPAEPAAKVAEAEQTSRAP